MVKTLINEGEEGNFGLMVVGAGGQRKEKSCCRYSVQTDKGGERERENKANLYIYLYINIFRDITSPHDVR